MKMYIQQKPHQKNQYRRGYRTSLPWHTTILRALLANPAGYADRFRAPDTLTLLKIEQLFQTHNQHPEWMHDEEVHFFPNNILRGSNPRGEVDPR